MKAIEQYFPVVLFTILYVVVLTLMSLLMKIERATILMKLGEYCFPLLERTEPCCSKAEAKGSNTVEGRKIFFSFFGLFRNFFNCHYKCDDVIFISLSFTAVLQYFAGL